ncbi:hypothetical protein CHL76_04360 [Marinococcus halophilus]|uniref:DUF1002 domain-containing protein n=1 Tax=Marinococcus halophilus TaxID=1371 RepID=A0A510Y6D4_MARHA|nr:DUF1002 domain-containing protein [Marinococcus halophilus]OZT81015.1 hypothetical protein CHL76_04360 [Marinococcus halophilus]GEK58723.1 hypothetical protein MHA01_16280 [Marinococcus halophilus]
MKWWQQTLAAGVVTLGALGVSQQVSADAATGDVTVTLGQDLSSEQRSSLLEEMEVTEGEVPVVEVTNEEEYQYLGDYLSSSEIGSRALSSAKITAAEDGEGIDIETNKIDTVTEGMYANALATAGVEDAEVYVTAPFNVSGTAALTGILKAYEQQNNVSISEDQKQVANEEIAKTSELGEDIGKEEATTLITEIKQEINNTEINNTEDIRIIVQNVSSDMNIELSEQQQDELVSLFDRMQNLNIDWSQMENQLNKATENIDSFMNSEDTQNFLSRIVAFLEQMLDSVQGWFNSDSGESA